MELLTLPPHSRVWIYQANRKLTRTEESFIRDTMSDFIAQWAAHGQSLRAGFSLEHSRFLIIAVDEEQAQASGCSIDASVAVVKKLENELGVDFFDRQIVAYLGDEGELKTTRLHDFWALRKAGVVTDDTKVFNNLVKNIKEWKDSWLVPFGQSWHAEMFR